MSKHLIFGSGIQRAAKPVNEIEELQKDLDEAIFEMDASMHESKTFGREMNDAEKSRFDMAETKSRLINRKLEAARNEQRAAAVINSPEMQSRMPEFLRGGGGAAGGDSQLRSPSGKPIAVARGPKERLSKQPVAGQHLIGELARAAAVGCTAFTPDAVRAELRSDENSKGGYSVPDLWFTNWFDSALEPVSLAQYCLRMIMDSESLSVTTIESRPTLAAKGQLDNFASTSIVFGSRRLEAFTAGGTMLASLEMLEDSPNAAAQIEMVSARGISDWFSDMMLNGTGSSGQPLGILQREDLPETGSIGVPNWSDIASAWTELRENCYTANALICSPAVYNVLVLQRELTAGDGAFLPRPEHLKDLPIVPSSHCPDTKLILADFTQLVLGIRQGARIEVSPHGDAFEKNAVSIRLKIRADWVPVDLSAFHILSGITLS